MPSPAQPSLPLRPGGAVTTTHDDNRNGRTALFAALNAATSEVLHDTRRSHQATHVHRTAYERLPPPPVRAGSLGGGEELLDVVEEGGPTLAGGQVHGGEEVDEVGGPVDRRGDAVEKA